VIPIDYPGFNMRLARHAHARGQRVLYYIAPQVWAWHAERAGRLARDTDCIAVILPFEEEFLRSRGAEAEFVGHPLLDQPEPAVNQGRWLRSNGLEPDRPVLALLPGSRRQEVDRHLPLFSAAARLVQLQRPEVQVVIGASGAVSEDRYAAAPYHRTRDSRDLLRHATAALVKSGTTTLEAALAGTPFIVAYRMNAGTYQLARRLVRVPHIALANLVGGRRIVPEFIQDEASPSRLAESLLPLLEHGNPARNEMMEGLKGVRVALERGGAAERVAEMAAELLAGTRGRAG
jgi:lipid-A-disaccharide synthase